jgi:predicted short-subunit dehydrogenase-like oxidoreductase (DUF2520 family)
MDSIMSPPLPTLSIIGCGRAATSIAKLLIQFNACQINQIVCQSDQSSHLAISRIGQGRASQSSDIEPCDIIMLGCPDDAISTCAKQLSGLKLKPGTIVFHLSGVESSATLTELSSQEVSIASIHPLKSFADINMAVESFLGTYCAIEGSEQATSVLESMFSKVGANVISIKAEDKPLWHLAGVMTSNYLIGLMHICESIYQKIGIKAADARKLMAPLATKTLEHNFKLGPVNALTGPIERGDIETVKKHLYSLEALEPCIKDIYTTLGNVLNDIAKLKTDSSNRIANNIIDDVLLND